MTRLVWLIAVMIVVACLVFAASQSWPPGAGCAL